MFSDTRKAQTFKKSVGGLIHHLKQKCNNSDLRTFFLLETILISKHYGELHEYSNALRSLNNTELVPNDIKTIDRSIKAWSSSRHLMKCAPNFILFLLNIFSEIKKNSLKGIITVIAYFFKEKESELKAKSKMIIQVAASLKGEFLSNQFHSELSRYDLLLSI